MNFKRSQHIKLAILFATALGSWTGSSVFAGVPIIRQLITTKHLPVVKVQVPPDHRQRATFNALQRAAHRGDIRAIGIQHKGGANLNVRDPFGRTPLMIAAFAKQHLAAETLIKLGADLNLLENDQYDALTIAGVANDIKMVKLLLAAGADATLTTSRYLGAALIAAAHLGHVEVVKALVAGKSRLDHVNNLGWTALIEAIVLGDGGRRHTEVVRVLVRAGANVNLPDLDGQMPLAMAEKRQYVEIIKILKSAGAKAS